MYCYSVRLNYLLNPPLIRLVRYRMVHYAICLNATQLLLLNTNLSQISVLVNRIWVGDIVWRDQEQSEDLVMDLEIGGLILLLVLYCRVLVS